jgi:outer membrane protein OmpA-like peptidoglycan-associated protein
MMNRRRRKVGRYQRFAGPDPSSPPVDLLEADADSASRVGLSRLRLSSQWTGRSRSPLVGVLFLTVLTMVTSGLWLARDGLGSWWNTVNPPPVTTLATTVPETLVTTTTRPELEDLIPAMEADLEQAGYSTLSVSVEDEVVYLEGPIPLDALEQGFFGYVAGAVRALDAPVGVEIRSRVRLKGDAAGLRLKIAQLVESRPIVFDDGALELGETSLPALDEIAAAINAQPGLTVLIAGHTDAAGSTAQNEQIGRARALVVFEYLVSRGVAPNRLAVISYGELFPQEEAASRRIEFEVVS